MIEDKYSILPGIEHESQTVFETSDVESDEEVPTEKKQTLQDNNDNDIIQDTFDLHISRDRFTNDIIVGDVDLMNFSGSISNTSLAGSGFKIKKVKETVDQRLARIHRELEQITLEQKHDDNNKTLKETNKLVQILEAIDQKKELKSNLDRHGNNINVLFEKIAKDIGQPFDQQQQIFNVQDRNTAQVLELDAKINNLENLIGVGPSQKPQLNTSDMVESNSNLVNIIRELKRKANIVNNPEYTLHIIKDELKLIREQTEKLISDRKLLNISQPNDTVVLDSENPYSSKIDDLYERLPEFETVNAKIPMVINRLKSLNTVHGDLARSIDIITTLDTVMNNMSQDIITWNEAVDNVNAKIDDYSNNIESKKQEVTKLVNDLYTRVDSIT